MPRQETIEVIVNAGAAKQTLSDLNTQANTLKATLGSINVGNTAQGLRDVASAQTQANNATRQSVQIQAQGAASARQQESALRRLGTAYGDLGNAQGNSLQSMTQWIQSQAGLENAQVRATGAINNAAGSFQTYRASVTAAGGGVQNFRFAVDSTHGTVYQLNQGVTSGASAMTTFGNAAKSAISTLKQLVGFYGVGSALRNAFQEMKSMSDEMIVYQKVTKSTEEQMAQVREQAYETAYKYGQTPTDYLAAASEMARAGYGQNSTAMADLAIKTKLVGDITAEEASQFLLAVDAGYKYQGNVEQLSLVLDQANEIGNNFATSIGKISDGMTLIASLGGQVGVPIEELMAALGTMTAVTQRSGSEMARALRSIFLNVLGDTTTEIEEGVTVTEEQMSALDKVIEKFGSDTLKAARDAGELIDPMEAIAALSQAFKEGLINEQELFQISKDIAGQRYYNAFAALVENYDGMYQEMLAKEKEALGSADNEVAVMVTSWESKLNQLSTTWTQVVNNTIKEGFIKSLIDGANGVLQFSGNLTNLAAIAGGAYTAIKSLGSGLSNVFRNQNFGGLNAFSVALSSVIVLLGAAKAAGENAFDNATKSAQEAAKASEELVKSTDTLYEKIKRYQELGADGIIDNSELSEAKTLQEEINALVGETAHAYDLVTGSIEGNTAALREMYAEQLRQSLEQAKTNTANAGIAVKGAAENWLDSLTGAGFRYDFLPEYTIKDHPEIVDYINENFKGYYDLSERDAPAEYLQSGYSISMKNGMSVDEYLDFYYKSKEMQTLFANSYTVDQLSQIQFYKDLSEGISKMSPVMEAYITTLDAQHGLESRIILDKEDFISKTFESNDALNAYVDTLAESYGLNEDQAKSLRDVAQAMGDVKKAADDLTGSGDKGKTTKSPFDDAKDSADALTNSINAAIQAKKNFDDAMSAGEKGDAADAYFSAYEAYIKEQKEGRVNSRRMYESAQMMMTEEKWATIEKTAEGVRKAVEEKAEGAVGSIKDGFEILNQEIKDEAGNIIQGAGVYELIQKSGVFSAEELVDAEGNLYIPQMTEAAINAISQAFSGMDKNAIMQTLYKLSMSDVNGTENGEDLFATASDEAAEAAGENADAQGEAADAAGKNAEEQANAANGANANAGAQEDAANAAGANADAQEQAAEGANANAEGQQNAADGANANAQAQEQGAETTGEAAETVDESAQTAADALTELADAANKAAAGLDPEGHGMDASQLTVEPDFFETEDEDERIAREKALMEEQARRESQKEKEHTHRGGNFGIDDDTRWITPEDIFTQREEGMGEESGEQEAESWNTYSHRSGMLEENDTPVFQDPFGNGLHQLTLDATFGDKGEPTAGTKGEELPLGARAAERLGTRAQKERSGQETGESNEQPPKGQEIAKEQYPYDDSSHFTAQDIFLKREQEMYAGVEAASTIDELEQRLTKTNGDVAASISDIGESWEGVQKAYAEIAKAEEYYSDQSILGAVNAEQFIAAVQAFYGYVEENPATVDLEADPEEAEQTLEDFLDEADNSTGTPELDADASKAEGELNGFVADANASEATVPVGADTREGQEQVDALINKNNGRTITINVETNNSGGGGLPSNETVLMYASGTREAQGGLSMVNEGSGPEIVVQRGQAFIPNGGRPTLINLDKGAKVFNASETRSLLSGQGVPAFADGTAGITLKNWLKTGKKEEEKKAGDTKKGNEGGYDYTGDTSDAKQGEKITKESLLKGIKSTGYSATEAISETIDDDTATIGEKIDDVKDAIDAAYSTSSGGTSPGTNWEDMDRTVRYLGEDGKWHWMADLTKIKSSSSSGSSSGGSSLTDKADDLIEENDSIKDNIDKVGDAVDENTEQGKDIQQSIEKFVLKLERWAKGEQGQAFLAKTFGSDNLEKTTEIVNRRLDDVIAHWDELANGTYYANRIEGKESVYDEIARVTGNVSNGGDMIKTENNGGATNITYNYSLDGVKIGREDAKTQSLASLMSGLSVYSNTLAS